MSPETPFPPQKKKGGKTKQGRKKAHLATPVQPPSQISHFGRPKSRAQISSTCGNRMNVPSSPLKHTTNMVSTLENRDRNSVIFFASRRQGKLPHVPPEPQRPGLPPQANQVQKLAPEPSPQTHWWP